MENLDILLIEDNLNDAELAIRALKKSNTSHEIVHISDGEDALEYLGKFKESEQSDHRSLPKLILLDLKLPKVDGFEVLRTIRSIPKISLVPVVILSSSGEERDILECYQSGANSYLVKPVAFDHFVETVAEVGRYWLGFNKTPVRKD